MALKQQQKVDEMTTNETEMVWNCNRDQDKGKCSSKILTGTCKTKGFEIRTRDTGEIVSCLVLSLSQWLFTAATKFWIEIRVKRKTL